MCVFPGAGLPAMDTAQAVSLLLGGDRVRLLLSQPLPAGLTSVGTHQQQQVGPSLSLPGACLP